MSREEISSGPVQHSNFKTNTDYLLKLLIDKISSADIKNVLVKKIVEPITIVVEKKVRPYAIGALIMYLVVLFLLFYIIWLIHRKH